MDKLQIEEIKALASTYGFDDARTAPWQEGGVLILFSNYTPGGNTDACRIGVSSYYIISNRAHENAAKLAEALSGMGIPAKRDASIPAQEAALTTGGRMSKNGFYFHPRFGSLVHIQTLRLEEKLEYYPVTVGMACGDCRACINACPCGAITDTGVDYSICLRKHMNGTIPDEQKPHVYQLYGCEKCQTACPMNKVTDTNVIMFDLEKTLKGETLADLQNLAGKNIARYVRTISQAIIYASNVGNASVAGVVQELAGDERFADACRYYLGRQKKKD